MYKHFILTIALLLTPRALYAADTSTLYGRAPLPITTPAGPTIDPAPLLQPLEARAIISQSQRFLIQPNTDLTTLNNMIKFMMSEAYTLHVGYTNILKNHLTEDARAAIQEKSNQYYDLYLQYFNMLYKSQNFVYVNEDNNFIILRSNNVDYRFKKSAITNLQELKTPAITQALEYFAQKNIVGVRANVICQPGSPNNSCVKFPQSVNGKTMVDMVGPVSIIYEPNDLKAAGASMYVDAQKAALAAKAPALYPPLARFEGVISALTPAGDQSLILTMSNAQALNVKPIPNTPSRLVFKLSAQDLKKTSYIKDTPSTVGEIFSLGSMVGRKIDIECATNPGCPYNEDTHVISGNLIYQLAESDDLRQLLIAKRNAEAQNTAVMKFTSGMFRYFNKDPSYVRLQESSGQLIATLMTSLTNARSLLAYERELNFAQANPTQYPVNIQLSCVSNACSKKDIKDASDKTVGTVILGPTNISVNPQDIRKIRSAMAAQANGQPAPTPTQDGAAPNAPPKAMYRTFLEFQEALSKARGNPQAIDGIFKQVLDDLSAGRIRGFVGQNGMFDLSNMNLSVVPRLLPEVFSKSSAQGLSLARNNLSSIQGLERIPGGRLRGIHLNDNPKLTSLAPIAGQPLEFLIAFNTSVSRDMNGLEALARGPASQSLKDLSLDNTGLTSITFLMNLQKLARLSVRFNPAFTQPDPKSLGTLTALQNRGVQIAVR